MSKMNLKTKSEFLVPGRLLAASIVRGLHLQDKADLGFQKGPWASTSSQNSPLHAPLPTLTSYLPEFCPRIYSMSWISLGSSPTVSYLLPPWLPFPVPSIASRHLTLNPSGAEVPQPLLGYSCFTDSNAWSRAGYFSLKGRRHGSVLKQYRGIIFFWWRDHRAFSNAVYVRVLPLPQPAWIIFLL